MFKAKLTFLFVILFACGCKESEDLSPSGNNTNGVDTRPRGAEDHAMHEQASDYIWDESSQIVVSLQGTSASSSGKGVSISGQRIKITAPGNYTFSGSLNNGQIIVDDETYGVVRLILNNVTIKSNFSSAIFIKNASKVIIVTPENTTNTLIDATTYTFDDTINQEPNATIFSKEDLSFTGNGKLNIEGNLQDGIASKDGLIFKSGNININAKDDAIRGKDYVIVRDGNFTLNATADGLKASEDTDPNLGYVTIDKGTFLIDAGDDGIHAERALLINNGKINIPKCREGLEGRTITINNGDIYVNASDDAINAGDGTDSRGNNSDLVFNMNGGYVVVEANFDGIDSNGQVNVNGGTLIVHGPMGLGSGALDYNGVLTINGGLLVATGSSFSTKQPSGNSKQNSVMVGFTSEQAANSLVRLQAENGTEIITFKPTKSYQSIIYSAPNLIRGNYDLFLQGISTGVNKDGILTGGTYSNGNKNTSFTITNTVTQVGVFGRF